MDERPPELRTDQPGVFPRRSPKGVYDNGILCKECEGLFQNPDDYAAKILIHGKANLEPIYSKGQEVGHLLKDYDYKLLKLFFISVLWRAHVSTEVFYRKVSLGPYAGQALRMIKSEDPGDPTEFSVMLARFRDHYASKVILDPHPERWWGVKAYRFYMGGFILHIKTDKQRFPQPISQTIMRPGEDFLIPSRDITNSVEFDVMKNVVSGN